MFDTYHAEKIINLLKQRKFGSHGLEVIAWSDDYDLGNIDSGGIVLFFNRPDDKQSLPKPEEVLVWARDGKLSIADVYIATNDIDKYIRVADSETCYTADIDVESNIKLSEESGVCGFAVVVKGLKLEIIDTWASAIPEVPETFTVYTKTLPREFRVGDKVRIVRKHTKRNTKWNNSWTGVMDRRVNDGNVYTIRMITYSGVYFEGIDLGWPHESLELANQEFDAVVIGTAAASHVVPAALDTKAAVQEELCTATKNKSPNHILFVDD